MKRKIIITSLLGMLGLFLVAGTLTLASTSDSPTPSSSFSDSRQERKDTDSSLWNEENESNYRGCHGYSSHMKNRNHMRNNHSRHSMNWR